MELTRAAHVAVVGVILALFTGCASAGRLAEIDSKYDRILASDCAGSKQVCWLQEQNRLKEKEYANSPLQQLRNAFAWGGSGTGNTTTFVTITN